MSRVGAGPVPRHLVYVTNTEKGMALYRPLAKRYATAQVVDMTPRTLIARGVRALARRKNIAWPLRIERLVMGGLLLWSVRNMARRGVDVDVVQWNPPVPVSRRWGRYCRLYSITDIAFDDEFIEAFSTPANIVGTYRRDWRNHMRWCDRVFTLTEWAADRNRQLHPAAADRIEAIGWGVGDVEPPSLAAVETAVRERIVLCVGHDYHRKGVDLLDQVARLVHAQEDRIGESGRTRFLVVGEPRGFDISTLADVEVLGPLPPAEVSQLMLRAQVFCLLSRYEPAGHVVVEAALHGLPCVVADVGGMPEAIGQVAGVATGRVVEAGAIAATADEINWLLRDNTFRARMGAAARAHAGLSSTWSSVAARMTL